MAAERAVPVDGRNIQRAGTSRKLVGSNLVLEDDMTFDYVWADSYAVLITSLSKT